MSESEFFPPSLPLDDKLTTFTFHKTPQIPVNEAVIMGIDEAGRGPVLGPMVYAVAYIPLSYASELKTHGYNDSKVLQADVRLSLFKAALEEPRTNYIGWATTVMTARDIGDGMLNPFNPYNLNDQAHDTTMALIQNVLDSETTIAELYVDTVGPPEKYQQKLKKRFLGIDKIVVAKKADSLYPVVSLASIFAKVTRDLSLEDQLRDVACGSGYPSDPNTVRWLEGNLDRVFGWGPLVRYSWGTAKTMLEKRGVEVVWPEEDGVQSAPSRGLPRVGLSIFGQPA